MPEVDGIEICWVGLAVEEVEGSVIRQGTERAGRRRCFNRIDSMLVGLEYEAVAGQKLGKD